MIQDPATPCRPPIRCSRWMPATLHREAGTP